MNTVMAQRTYQITLKLPGLQSEGVGEAEAIAITERLEAELGAVRITIRELDPATGKPTLPFYAKAEA